MSNETGNDADVDYIEESAVLIAEIAAKLVAANDLGPDEAVAAAANWLRRENAAEGDESQTEAVENEFPTPSAPASAEQVETIAAELMAKAREAAATL